MNTDRNRTQRRMPSKREMVIDECRRADLFVNSALQICRRAWLIVLSRYQPQNPDRQKQFHGEVLRGFTGPRTVSFKPFVEMPSAVTWPHENSVSLQPSIRLLLPPA